MMGKGGVRIDGRKRERERETSTGEDETWRENFVAWWVARVFRQCIRAMYGLEYYVNAI